MVMIAHALIVDASRSESTCASSDGNRLKRGAHKAGMSIFGTKSIPGFERYMKKG